MKGLNDFCTSGATDGWMVRRMDERWTAPADSDGTDLP